MSEGKTPDNVTLNGKTFKPLADGEYDVVVMGTGLTEVIVAGLLATEGRKVLMVDRNNYYGGESASLNLTNLYQKFRGCDPPAAAVERLGANRDWSIDLIPKFIMARGKLTKILLKTNVHNYLEFKKVDGSYVYKGDSNRVYKMPGTATEALGTPLLSFLQKRWFKSFLQFVSKVRDPEFNPDGEEVDLSRTTMREVFKKQWLDDDSSAFAGHAMALQPDDSYLDKPAGPTVRAIQLYAYSLAAYSSDAGGKTPYIYPLYGLGSLSESFSRKCAISGGTFMLDRDVDEVLFDESGRAIGVRSGDEAAKAGIIIGDPSYFEGTGLVRETGKVARSIFILDHPVPNTDGAESAQIIIPGGQVSKAGYPARATDIYVSVVSHAHLVASKGLYIAIASTSAATGNPIEELKPAEQLLGPCVERFNLVSTCYEPTEDGTRNKCFISRSYDASSHFETTLADVADLYRRITGNDLDLSTRSGGAGAGAGAGGSA